MATTLLVGARHQQGRRRVVDADERQHQPGRVVRGQLLVQHDLFGDRHPAAPLGGPVRHRVSGAVQFGEPRLLEADEFVVVDAGLSPPPVGGDVLGTPRPHLVAKLFRLSVGHANSPVKPVPPTLLVSRSRVADSPSGSRRSGWL